MGASMAQVHATLVWVVLALICLSRIMNAQAVKSEEFSEDLLLRPMADGKVLAHFLFTHRLPPISAHGDHHRLFPKAIYQLVQKFRIQEMELSFTHGRWDYQRWGGLDPIASANGKPAGVELWAQFDKPNDQVDATWGNLTHALSGLFCASINFLESPALVATPGCGFRPEFNNAPGAVQGRDDCILNLGLKRGGSKRRGSQRGVKRIGRLRDITVTQSTSGSLRYGALPREAVCTENLTPWLKLLPCRDKAGLATLLDRPSIYSTFYHSMRVHVKSGEFNNDSLLGVFDKESGTSLHLSLTIVLKPSKMGGALHSGKLQQPNWSLRSLFRKALAGKCPLATSSHVFLELEGLLVDKLRVLQDAREEDGDQKDQGGNEIKADGQGGSLQGQGAVGMRRGVKDLNLVDNTGFLLSTTPDGVLQEARGTEEQTKSRMLLLNYDVQKYSKEHPLNLGMTWRAPITWSPRHGPFRATRFLIGSGNERGSIAMVLKANAGGHWDSCSNMPGENVPSDICALKERERKIDITIFQMVPWYVRFYAHTLKVILDGHPIELWEVAKWMQYSPSEDRQSPSVVEMQLQVPTNTSMVSLTVEFDKGFLRIDEHPPDANRGFDLPAARFTFPFSQTARQYVAVDSTFVADADQPILQTMLEERPVQMYSASLLVPLATPDFSMPYNVITFTMTVLALYFGSMLNALRRRLGEEERQREETAGSGNKGKLRQLLSKYFGGRLNSKDNAAASKQSKQFKKVLRVVMVVAVAVAIYYALGF